MKRRNPNIETLRCLLMFLIVVYHSYTHGIFAYGAPCEDSSSAWVLFMRNAFIWHVDAFVIISGWFGIRFRWSKFLRLYGLIGGYTVAGLVLTAYLMPGKLSFTSVYQLGDWFGSSYLMLMLIAPMLNAGIEHLIQDQPARLYCSWLLVTIGMVMASLPKNIITSLMIFPSGLESCSLLTLVYVYFTARVARFYWKSLPTRHIVLWFLLIFGVVNVLFALLNILRQMRHGHDVVVAKVLAGVNTYYSPHVIMVAMAVFLIFNYKIRIPHRLGRFFVFLAPSMFAVYLIHVCTPIGRLVYCKVQSFVFAQNAISPLFACLVSALAVFMGCLIIDLIRRCALIFVKEAVDNWLWRVDCYAKKKGWMDDTTSL